MATLKERARPLLPLGILLLGNVLFRLPALLNADGVHSDAAIVGLQAMHILKGEWSRFLWGAGYQSSFDAFVVAAFFAIGGPSGLKLMLAPFTGHLLLTAFAWMTLHPTLGRWKAMLACVPLVLTPQAINGVALYAPRQWSLTFMFAAILLVNGMSKRPWTALPAALVGAFAVYLDLFTLQIAAPVCIFGLMTLVDAPRSVKTIGTRLAFGIVGLGLAYAFFTFLRQGPGASSNQASLNFEAGHLQHNFDLLKNTCLPWLLGAKSLYPEEWHPPALVAAWQSFGAFMMLVSIATALPLVFVTRIPWEVRRLALFGFGGSVASLLGFLVSNMPQDQWSARYLAPIVWLSPFSFAAITWLLKPKLMVLTVLLPTMPVAAVGGWLSFWPFTSGPLPVLSPRGQADEERAVCQALRDRGITYAAAQYWLSYRLTFICRENPIVVPYGEDRYPPYQQGFAAQRKTAWIFHPSEPRLTPEQMLPALQGAGGTVQKLNIAEFTILVHER